MSSKIKKTDVFVGYGSFLEELKQKIRQAQVKASLAVKSELIQIRMRSFYYAI